MLTVILLLVYGGALIALSSRGSRGGGALDFLLDGRRLTLPAFVATLVTTWYGGILGVGEYAWSYGISTWLVFGLPYYVAAVVFAFGLAARLSRSGAVSLPDLLGRTYGPAAARTGAVGVLAFSLPVAYALMLGVLLEGVTGWPRGICVTIALAFSALYVGLSGFRAVVRTDVLQMVLMYGGFALLLPAALEHTGGIAGLWQSLPSTHRSWDGGLGWQTVAVWYLIALQTVVDPTFAQRVFAARSADTARRGVLISVGFWAVFDFLSTFSGLAARVLIPDLGDPLTAYQRLADLVLSPVGVSIFTLGLFATVMSTVDSYLFLAAATLGDDLAPTASSSLQRRTRTALAVAAVLTLGGTFLFDSAVTVWHHVGSVVTSALLLPVVAVHLPARWRPPPWFAVAAMVLAASTATLWIVIAGGGDWPLGLEPMFPALAASFCCWIAGVSTAARHRHDRDQTSP